MKTLGPGRFAEATAPSNLALIKYWGKNPRAVQTPLNSSISLTLDRFQTRTQIQTLPITDPHEFVLRSDSGAILQSQLSTKGSVWLERVLREIDEHAGIRLDDGIGLSIDSQNDFPTAAGIASSASGYAAWTKALIALFELEKHLDPNLLQSLAARWGRLGSGSALRSLWLKERESTNQFVAWQLDPTRLDSTIKLIEHNSFWNRLRHRVILLDSSEKKISSSRGHGYARTSVLQRLREAQAETDCASLTEVLQQGEFDPLISLVEHDALHMHAVMLTGMPAQKYLSSLTSQALAVFIEERNRRRWPACWTLDAGPNPHLLYLDSVESEIADWAETLPFRLGMKTSASRSSRRVRARASAKVILLGEHSAVFGYPALAVPLENMEMRLCGYADGSALTPLSRWNVRIQGYAVTLSASEYSRLEEAWSLTCRITGANADACRRFSIDSEIPLSAGLGGSAALSVAMVRLALQGVAPVASQGSAVEALANQVEQLFHGTASGLDTAACAAQTPIVFDRKNGPVAIPFPTSDSWFALIDSGERAATQAQIEKVRQARDLHPAQSEQALRELGTLAEAGITHFSAERWPELGGCFTQAQRCLRQLEASTQQIDTLCASLESAGALGAKLTGAGGGGMVLALFASRPARESLAQSLDVTPDRIHVFCLGREASS